MELYETTVEHPLCDGMFVTASMQVYKEGDWVFVREETGEYLEIIQYPKWEVLDAFDDEGVELNLENMSDELREALMNQADDHWADSEPWYDR